MAAPQADRNSPLRRKIRPAMMQKRISLFISVTPLYEAVVSKTTCFLLFKSIKNLDFMGSCK